MSACGVDVHIFCDHKINWALFAKELKLPPRL